MNQCIDKSIKSVSSSLPFTFSVPKPYVFGSETVRFWDGEHTVLGRKP